MKKMGGAKEVKNIELQHDENLHIGLFMTFNGKTCCAELAYAVNSKIRTYKELEEQMRHLSFAALRKLVKEGIITGSGLAIEDEAQEKFKAMGGM